MSTNQTSRITKAEWFGHVERWRGSGLSKSEYCRQYGIGMHALSYWVARQREQESAGKPLTLVPAKLTSQVEVPRSEALVLQCANGSRLHLPANTSAMWLGTLLAQLR